MLLNMDRFYSSNYWWRTENDPNVTIYDFSRLDQMSVVNVNNINYCQSYQTFGKHQITLTAPSSSRRPKILSNDLGGKSVLEFDNSLQTTLRTSVVDNVYGSLEYSIFVLSQVTTSSFSKPTIIRRTTDGGTSMNYQHRYDGNNRNVVLFGSSSTTYTSPALGNASLG
jgi:hypothetical protein